jgi:hypothetical protein
MAITRRGKSSTASRGATAGTLLCVLALGVGGASGAAAKTQPRTTAAQRQAATNQTRAIAAYQAMQAAYYDPTTGLYKGAQAWPYSQAMAATISVAALPKMHARYRPDLVARLSGLQAYADHVAPAPGGYVAQLSAPATGATRFNDDNEWIGIELLRLYHVDHSAPLLSAASGLLTMVDSQWSTNTSLTCAGGVPWQSGTANGDRNTVSNATGAELGAQLYLTTHESTDLSWAEQMYNWVRSCLLAPNGMYSDHIAADGEIDPTQWTYNQGTMIGAGVMLYQATGNTVYLQQAQSTAQAALAAFGPAQLADQPVYFNAIYIRNLLLLGAASGDTRYQRFAQSFADDAWYNVRDYSNDLFLADPGGQTKLLDQAAMVQVYALLAEPTSAYF